MSKELIRLLRNRLSVSDARDIVNDLGYRVERRSNLFDALSTGGLDEHVSTAVQWASQHDSLTLLVDVIADWRAELADEVRRCLPLNVQRNTTPAFFQVPYADSPCFGRKKTLRKVMTLLSGGQVVNLTGIGGVGKTFLAAMFAYKNRASYTGGVFWLAMDNPEHIGAEVARCGCPDGLNVVDWQDLNIEQQILAVRSSWRESIPRLLVFDNIEDPSMLEEWRPGEGGCHLLLTSRNDQWHSESNVFSVRLAELSRKASRKFLCTRRAHTRGVAVARLATDPAADKICALLGDLPLALSLASIYLSTYRTVSLNDYATHLQASPLDLNPADSQQNIVQLSPLEQTIKLSYSRLNPTLPLDGQAMSILHLAARCSPEPIPLRLLLRAEGFDPDDYDDRIVAAKILGRLFPIGLLGEETTQGEAMVKLHRLIGAFVRQRAVDSEREIGAIEEALIDEIHAIMTQNEPLKGLPYLPHAQHIAALVDDHVDERAAALFNALAYLYDSIGNYEAGRIFYERALSIHVTVLGTDHPDTATTLNNLAALYYHTGAYDIAERLYTRSLSIREKTLGSNHPSIANSLYNLALLREQSKDFAAARMLKEKALAVREASLEPEHPDIAMSLHSLAALHHVEGHIEIARHLYERAYAIQEKILGREHPDTITTLNNIALLTEPRRDISTRSMMYREPAIRETVQGLVQLHMAATHSALAATHREQADFANAYRLYERVLETQEKDLGAEHPDLALTLNHMAEIQEIQSQFLEAQHLYARALDIIKKEYGTEHATYTSMKEKIARLNRHTSPSKLKGL